MVLFAQLARWRDRRRVALERDNALSLSLQVEICKASTHCETDFWFSSHELEIQIHNPFFFFWTLMMPTFPMTSLIWKQRSLYHQNSIRWTWRVLVSSTQTSWALTWHKPPCNFNFLFKPNNSPVVFELYFWAKCQCSDSPIQCPVPSFMWSGSYDGNSRSGSINLTSEP